MISKMKVLAIIVLIVSAADALKPLGKIIKDTKIIGGTAAEAGEFPWACAIYKTSPSGTFFGGGSLIRPSWVLTVAQLVYDATSIEIHFGSNILEGDDPNRVIVTATNWILYDTWNATLLWQDIALVKLDSPIESTDYIQPIPVGAFGTYIYPGRELTAIGWGQTSDIVSILLQSKFPAGDVSNELLKTTVAIIDQHVCEGYYGDALIGSMVCAVAATGNQGTCYGDIGSPLLAPVNSWEGNWTIVIAMSSWMSANGCQSSDPNGFTRADSFHDWINTVVDA